MKRISKIPLIVGVFALLLAGRAFGATYTVCASGCDHVTIQAAVNAAIAVGDTVEVRADTVGGAKTYREQVTMANSGSEGQPISLIGRDGDSIEVSGADLAGAWEQLNIYKSTVSTLPNAIWVDGVLGTKKTSISTLILDNDWWWEGGALFIYSSTNPSDKTIESSVRVAAIETINKNYVSFKNLKGTKASSQAFKIFMGGFISVEDCVFDGNNKSYAMYISGQNADNGIKANDIVINNVKALNGKTQSLQIANNVDGVLIKKSTMSGALNNGMEAYTMNASARPTSNIIVENCDTFSNRIGINIGYLVDSMTVRYNRVFNNIDNGIYLDLGPKNSVVNNNLVFNNRHGISIASGTIGETSNSLIYSNLLYDNHFGVELQIRDVGTSHGINNVFRDNSICNSSVIVYADQGSHNNLVHDNPRKFIFSGNNYTGPGPALFYDGNSNLDFDNWVINSGDTNSLYLGR